MKKFFIFGISIVFQTLIISLLYSTNERQFIYWGIVVLITIINLIILGLLLYKHKNKNFNYIIPVSAFIGSLVVLFIYSYFQFSYVIMPTEFFDNDVFYNGYDYNDLKDEVRIEYYARNFRGSDEVYSHSYDKDEIKTFLEFFKEAKLLRGLQTYNNLGNPEIMRDWNEDIHVMIRNMEDEESGYYIFHIDIVDNSDYTYVSGSGDNLVFYKLPDGLREFVYENMYKNIKK